MAVHCLFTKKNIYFVKKIIYQSQWGWTFYFTLLSELLLVLLPTQIERHCRLVHSCGVLAWHLLRHPDQQQDAEWSRWLASCLPLRLHCVLRHRLRVSVPAQHAGSHIAVQLKRFRRCPRLKFSIGSITITQLWANMSGRQSSISIKIEIGVEELPSTISTFFQDGGAKIISGRKNFWWNLRKYSTVKIQIDPRPDPIVGTVDPSGDLTHAENLKHVVATHPRGSSLFFQVEQWCAITTLQMFVPLTDQSKLIGLGVLYQKTTLSAFANLCRKCVRLIVDKHIWMRRLFLTNIRVVVVAQQQDTCLTFKWSRAWIPQGAGLCSK